MKGGILSDVGKSAKQLAIDTARKAAREPAEILKSAAQTIVSPDVPINPVNIDRGTGQKPEVKGEKKKEEAEKKDLRTVEALNREIEDIRMNKLIEDIREKIQAGQVVYFENYPELSPEQIDLLKAQQEQMEEKRKMEARQGQGGVPAAAPKRGRRLSFSRKKAAERETTRTERPLPPSG